MQAIDLHTHSNRSDGSYTPAELVEYAIQKNLKAIALTDHDTVAGLDEAIHAADTSTLEVIPGIELSTEYCIGNTPAGKGKDVHIVGLFIDYHKKEFVERLQEFVDSRVRRNEKMCRNLQKAGIDITFEKLQAANEGSVITRAHYATYLLEHGYVKDRNHAFDKYLGDHTPYFVPREKITPEMGIQLILSAGGVPILAHPVLYHLSDAHLEELVGKCKSAGLKGIEAIYSTYSPSEERQIRRIAKEYDLLISGGSDFHGKNKAGLDLGNGYGKLFVPEDILEPIRKEAGI